MEKKLHNKKVNTEMKDICSSRPEPTILISLSSLCITSITLLHNWHREMTTILAFLFLQKIVLFLPRLSIKQLDLQSLATLTFENYFPVQEKYMESV